MKLWNTEIYLMTPDNDRTYFIDQTADDAPIGLCERHGITLKERPIIPTADMRYNEIVVPGRHSSYKRPEGYDDIEIPFIFNFISQKPREVYGRVVNALRKMEPGTGLRLSDDDDGIYRVLARTPRIDPLDNDLAEWGEFTIHFTFEPFRFIEEPEVTIEAGMPTTFTSTYANAFDTPQIIEHLTNEEINKVTMNGHDVYKVTDAPVEEFVVDGTTQYAFGEEYSSGGGYPLRFWNNLDNLRMEFVELPYEGMNYRNDIDVPDGISSDTSGNFLFFNVSTHTVNIPDGGPDSFLRFDDANGNPVEKAIHAETVVLDYNTTHLTNPDDVRAEQVSIGFVASESQRFILIRFANQFRHGTRITVETETQTFDVGTGQSGRPYYEFEHDKEIKITVQDMHQVEPPVTHIFRTEQSGGELLGVRNLNKYMEGGFLMLKDGSNTIESTGTIRFRPLWQFL